MTKPRAGATRCAPPAWRSRARWLRRHGSPLFVAAVLVLAWAAALALGYWGFYRHAAATGTIASPLDLAYLTLQLIVLQFGPAAGDMNLALNTARFLLPLLSASTVVAAAALLFRDQLDLLKLWLAHDHVIICGLGRRGYLLAQRYRARGRAVVVIEKDGQSGLLDRCRQMGAHVLVGDAADERLLEKAMIGRARRLIAVCEDKVNAEIAVRAWHAYQACGSGSLTCHIHVADEHLYALLREQSLGARTSGPVRVRIEPFNLYASGAHLIWQEHPAFRAPDRGGRAPSVLIVGLGQLGEHLLLQMGRAWWEMLPPCERPPGEAANMQQRRVQVAVVDRNAKERTALVRLRHPQLAQVCELVPFQMDVRSSDFERAEYAAGIDAAYVCLDDDYLSIDAGLVLYRRITSPRAPIVLRMSEDSGMARLLAISAIGEQPSEAFCAFSLLDHTCTPDLVEGGLVECLARRIHDAYRQRREASQVWMGGEASMASWDALSEELKESNRRQAEHICAKLHAAGCLLEPLTDWRAGDFAFTGSEVELMARLEHERWCAEMAAAGYRYAAGPKDAKAKTHPDLVPWEVLPESEKEKDRGPVRSLPRWLADAGFQIVRRR